MKTPYKNRQKKLEDQIRNITHYDELNEQDPMARARKIRCVIKNVLGIGKKKETDGIDQER